MLNLKTGLQVNLLNATAKEAKKFPLPPDHSFSLLPIPSLCSSVITAIGALSLFSLNCFTRYLCVDAKELNDKISNF